MQCPACRCEMPADAEFCDSPWPRSYTPKHLAEKILTARGAHVGHWAASFTDTRVRAS